MDSILQKSVEYASIPTALVLTVALLVAIYTYAEWRHLPPGPVGIPYFGYYPFLKQDITSQFREMAKKYGEVFSIRITGQLYIHLGSLSSIREAHVAKYNCFALRPTNYTIATEMFNDGLAFVNGEAWKILRTFFVQTLKEFGMGKEIQERVVAEGIKDTLDTLRMSSGRNVDALSLITRNCNSTTRHLLFSGIRLSSEDAERLTDAYKNMVHVSQHHREMVLLCGPVVKYFISLFNRKYRHSVKNRNVMKSLLIKIIKEHEATFDKDNLRDLVDYYINEKMVLQARGDPKAKVYTDSSLVYSLIQFFGDGTFAIGWLVSDILKELAKYPHVQKQIQSEIDEVVGRGRLPNWGDRGRLSYTTAALHEVQRMSDMLPILPSLQCSKETTIQGHRIPKGAVTLPNFWCVHHNPEVYENVATFDPTRFMPQKSGRPKEELPNLFGIGKRSCAGEALTSMQVLLFVATILQNFDLHPADLDSSAFGADDWKIWIRATPRPS